MLTLTKVALPPGSFSHSSSVLLFWTANMFFRKDRTGGQPTTCALKFYSDEHIYIYSLIPWVSVMCSLISNIQLPIKGFRQKNLKGYLGCGKWKMINKLVTKPKDNQACSTLCANNLGKRTRERVLYLPHHTSGSMKLYRHWQWLSYFSVPIFSNQDRSNELSLVFGMKLKQYKIQNESTWFYSFYYKYDCLFNFFFRKWKGKNPDS